MMKTRIIFIFLFLSAVSLLSSQQVQTEQPAQKSDHFNLVSINSSFLIHLMSDLEKIQKHIPLQGSRLDVLHRRYSWFRYGTVSAFLFETDSNPAGKDYIPRAFISFLPLGGDYLLVNKRKWNFGISGMLYWANYMQHVAIPSNVNDYITDYPKLLEVNLRAEISALLNLQAGYRYEFGKGKNDDFKRWEKIIRQNDYSGFFIELNIGLQSLHRKERIRFIPNPVSDLSL